MDELSLKSFGTATQGAAIDRGQTIIEMVSSPFEPTEAMNKPPIPHDEEIPSGCAISIRAARTEDAAVLGRLYAECFPFLFRFAYGADPPIAGPILADFYNAKVIHISNVYLAWNQGVLVGFAVMRLGEAMQRPGAAEFWHVLRRHLGVIRAARAFIGSFIVSLVFSGRSPDPKMAYLDTLAVGENRRGEGIGTALLDYCFDLASQKGCSEIALHVIKSNVNAKRLYERVGFVARNDERVLPRVLAPFAPASRAWLMVKTLEGNPSPINSEGG